MGNRACIVFFDRTRVSPTVYLHWHGDAVPSWLDQLKVRMHGRFSDAAYAAARFVGICHANIDGNLSLGISLGRISNRTGEAHDSSAPRTTAAAVRLPPGWRSRSASAPSSG